MRRSSIAFLVCAILASAAAWAQSTTDGAIGGTVVDPSNAAVAGANVTARNMATNASAKAETDINGRYIIIHLQPGVYELDVASQGLAAAKRTQIFVEVGRVTNLDVAMTIQATSETVQVVGEAPVVNTDQQDFNLNLNQTDINNLPINGRRWSNFALMSPGTATDGGYGDISFRRSIRRPIRRNTGARRAPS